MGDDMQEPRGLRNLRLMVMVLMGAMIVGITLIVAMIGLRLGNLGTAAESALPDMPTLPPGLTLPEGESAQALTLGTGWLAVVTRDASGTQRIRLFAPDGTAGQVLVIDPPR